MVIVLMTLYTFFMDDQNNSDEIKSFIAGVKATTGFTGECSTMDAMRLAAFRVELETVPEIFLRVKPRWAWTLRTDHVFQNVKTDGLIRQANLRVKGVRDRMTAIAVLRNGR